MNEEIKQKALHQIIELVGKLDRKGITFGDFIRQVSIELDKAWEIAQQDAIYWHGWLEQVMSEHLAEGISEKTKEKVLKALKNNRF